MWRRGWRRRRRFKKFKIVIKKRRFQILGEFNPWVLLADGTVVDVETKGGLSVGGTGKFKRMKGETEVEGSLPTVKNAHRGWS